jgi:hypothetical protein
MLWNDSVLVRWNVFFSFFFIVPMLYAALRDRRLYHTLHGMSWIGPISPVTPITPGRAGVVPLMSSRLNLRLRYSLRALRYAPILLFDFCDAVCGVHNLMVDLVRSR